MRGNRSSKHLTTGGSRRDPASASKRQHEEVSRRNSGVSSTLTRDNGKATIGTGEKGRDTSESTGSSMDANCVVMVKMSFRTKSPSHVGVQAGGDMSGEGRGSRSLTSSRTDTSLFQDIPFFSVFVCLFVCLCRLERENFRYVGPRDARSSHFESRRLSATPGAACESAAREAATRACPADRCKYDVATLHYYRPGITGMI